MTKIASIAAVAAILSVSIVPNPAWAQADPNFGIEAKVRAGLADMPAMIEIAKCESGFRQFAPDGSVLRGGAGKKYIGIFQFSESLHGPRALGMAYDLNTVDGNIAYARYTYFASGTNPWKSCLANPASAATPAPVPAASVPAPANESLTVNMQLGMTNSQVAVLQRMLNSLGFSISASGPGSPGNETSYFGSLTRQAVQRFQCARSLVCSGTESSTGYGRVGPQTRAALNNR